jgi:hypothetical protein
MPRSARRYLSYSPASIRKHCELAAASFDAAFGSLDDDVLHHVLSFLPLDALVAVACTSSAFSAAAADPLATELFKLRRAWDSKFSALTAFRPGIANVVASTLVDDSLARPRTLLWAGAVHCVVGFFKRVSPGSLCARNAATILYNLSALPVMAVELEKAGGIAPLVEAVVHLSRTMSRARLTGETLGCNRAARLAAVILSRVLTGSGSTPACVQAVHHALALQDDAIGRFVELLHLWGDEDDVGDEDGASPPEEVAVGGEPRQELMGARPIAALLASFCHSGGAPRAALIDAGCTAAASELLRHPAAEVRLEAARLLGSLTAAQLPGGHDPLLPVTTSSGNVYNGAHSTGVKVANTSGTARSATTGLTPDLARVSVTSRAFRLLCKSK